MMPALYILYSHFLNLQTCLELIQCLFKFTVFTVKSEVGNVLPVYLCCFFWKLWESSINPGSGVSLSSNAQVHNPG